MFEVACLYSGSFWFLFIVEVPPCGWGWTSGLLRFPVLGGGGMLASMFWCVKLDRFSLECNEVSSSQFWVVCGFGVALGSHYFNVLGCTPVFLANYHGVSCTGTC